MMERRRASPSGRPAHKRPGKRTQGRWSQRVTRESDALDLERGVFKLGQFNHGSGRARQTNLHWKGKGSLESFFRWKGLAAADQAA